MIQSCRLCPRTCGVNRSTGRTGFCGAPNKPKLARVSLHFWEEPCISGTNGSGAVFFSHCNLKCIYCQNFKISQEHFGIEIDVSSLASIFLSLQQKGAHNVNLVSPTPYIPYIVEAINEARLTGLKIPIVYNSNGYEEVSALKELAGLVDIYLPDLKYARTETAEELSSAPNYFLASTKAILEMYRQVGSPTFDKNGLMTGGLMIRHLLLPGHLAETSEVLNWVATNLPNEVFISLMAQYTPLYLASNYPSLNRHVTKREYNQAVEILLTLGLESGYVQEMSSADQSYVPCFDGTGIK